MNSADHIEQLESEVSELLATAHNLTAEIVSLRKANSLQKVKLYIYRCKSDLQLKQTSGNSSLQPSYFDF